MVCVKGLGFKVGGLGFGVKQCRIFLLSRSSCTRSCCCSRSLSVRIAPAHPCVCSSSLPASDIVSGVLVLPCTLRCRELPASGLPTAPTRLRELPAIRAGELPPAPAPSFRKDMQQGVTLLFLPRSPLPAHQPTQETSPLSLSLGGKRCRHLSRGVNGKDGNKGNPLDGKDGATPRKKTGGFVKQLC